MDIINKEKFFGIAQIISKARREGYDMGYGMAMANNAADMPQDMDSFIGLVQDTYEHAMQFSPEEFRAREYNDSDDPDAMWESFDRGLAAGARAAYNEIHMT